MKEKPVYESPKVSSLDEKDSVIGGGIIDERCGNGSNAFDCSSGNGAEPIIN